VNACASDSVVIAGIVLLCIIIIIILLGVWVESPPNSLGRFNLPSPLSLSTNLLAHFDYENTVIIASMLE